MLASWTVGFGFHRVITGYLGIGSEILDLLVTAVFSIVVLVMEQDDPDSPIKNLIDCGYWGIATLTTTGYGDAAPRTPAGRLLASAFCLYVRFFGTCTHHTPLAVTLVRFFNRKHKRGASTTNEDTELLEMKQADDTIRKMEMQMNQIQNQLDTLVQLNREQSQWRTKQQHRDDRMLEMMQRILDNSQHISPIPVPVMETVLVPSRPVSMTNLAAPQSYVLPTNKAIDPRILRPAIPPRPLSMNNLAVHRLISNPVAATLDHRYASPFWTVSGRPASMNNLQTNHFTT